MKFWKNLNWVFKKLKISSPENALPGPPPHNVREFRFSPLHCGDLRPAKESLTVSPKNRRFPSRSFRDSGQVPQISRIQNLEPLTCLEPALPKLVTWGGRMSSQDSLSIHPALGLAWIDQNQSQSLTKSENLPLQKRAKKWPKIENSIFKKIDKNLPFFIRPKAGIRPEIQGLSRPWPKLVTWGGRSRVLTVTSPGPVLDFGRPSPKNFKNHQIFENPILTPAKIGVLVYIQTQMYLVHMMKSGNRRNKNSLFVRRSSSSPVLPIWTNVESLLFWRQKHDKAKIPFEGLVEFTFLVWRRNRCLSTLTHPQRVESFILLMKASPVRDILPEENTICLVKILGKMPKMATKEVKMIILTTSKRHFAVLADKIWFWSFFRIWKGQNPILSGIFSQGTDRD